MIVTSCAKLQVLHDWKGDALSSHLLEQELIIYRLLFLSCLLSPFFANGRKSEDIDLVKR